MDGTIKIITGRERRRRWSPSGDRRVQLLRRAAELHVPELLPWNIDASPAADTVKQ